MYSMTVARNSDDFRLLYPVTRSSPDGLYHLEILFILLVTWACGSKIFALLIVAFVQMQSHQGKNLELIKPQPATNSMTETVRRHTGLGFQLLWTLFIYWLYVMVNYLTEQKAAKIPVALVLCTLVGLSLNVNGFVLWRSNKIALDSLKKQLGDAQVSDASVMSYIVGNTWTGLRFFIVPFCVSSYSIVSSANDKFVYLFPVGSVGVLPDMVLQGIIILTFVCLSQIFRVLYFKSLNRQEDQVVTISQEGKSPNLTTREGNASALTPRSLS